MEKDNSNEERWEEGVKKEIKQKNFIYMKYSNIEKNMKKLLWLLFIKLLLYTSF